VIHERADAGGAVTPQRAVAEATESAAPRFVGVFAVVLPAGLLVQALVDHASYRDPVVPVVVWLGMVAAAAWLLPPARSGDPTTAPAIVAGAVAGGAGTAIGPDPPGPPPPVARGWGSPRHVWPLALRA